MKQFKKFVWICVAVVVVAGGVYVMWKHEPVTYQAESVPVQTKKEVKDIRDREDVRKRIELAEKQIVLEATRQDEVERHDTEMARLEAELEKVRGEQLEPLDLEKFRKAGSAGL